MAEYVDYTPQSPLEQMDPFWNKLVGMIKPSISEQSRANLSSSGVQSSAEKTARTALPLMFNMMGQNLQNQQFAWQQAQANRKQDYLIQLLDFKKHQAHQALIQQNWMNKMMKSGALQRGSPANISGSTPWTGGPGGGSEGKHFLDQDKPQTPGPGTGASPPYGSPYAANNPYGGPQVATSNPEMWAGQTPSGSYYGGVAPVPQDPSGIQTYMPTSTPYYGSEGW